ncbi:unnamed protein product [Kuraishia capsulata CBS 1993]|uniref:Amine oxidase domain-containing protein n=1 Tax=Kuraishia capsulata CBS 1993 TaxID=1382522 RepID=W6MLY9_9ASCO|nr:uncharacterized protein KUCA_T00003170001 [Kuraishia capsulata CBS 1993]CDK27193.1 unnamed protein product [Kuraishia capsulata CBS 1993]
MGESREILYDVCVIGAGVAGLKAAQELEKFGVNYVVLEGRNRTGGRIHTDRTGLVPYDMGGSWFHDTLTNPFFDEVRSRAQDFDLFYDDGKPVYLNESGVDLEHEKVPQVVKEMEKYVELRYFESIEVEDISLKEATEEYTRKQASLLSEAQAKFAPAMLRQLELWHGVSWDQMSSKYALVDNVGRNCLVRGGYDKVIGTIEAEIPVKRIILNQTVNYVRRNGEYMVIKTSEREYRAKFVIVTIPQSVLQSNDDTLGSIKWEPELPGDFRESLSRMSFGSLGKFVFEFEHLFWSPEYGDRFVTIPTPGEANHTCWDHPVLMLNMFSISGVASVLCFTQGDITRNLEARPDEAWEYFKPIFEKLKVSDYGDLPEPKRCISSTWTLDPLSRGSYAACEPGDDPVEVAITLSQGLGNLRFAGEHTILDGAGAVHGAWLSGKREAVYILQEMGLMERKEDHWQ